ncbi:MAG: hypothetical protein F6K47_38855 [Symploca sp. SIO2E6]|nr:hypothetical protein [Symploca sp. SIO2E6]
MANGKTLQPSQYAKHRYNIEQPIDFDVAVNYGAALMAIAGADGELVEKEFQWYIDEQELLMEDSKEYIDTLRKFDWKNAKLDELLGGISYNFPLNFKRSMLYQAIKMSGADGSYHDKEKAAVAKAAELLGIERSVVVSLESLAELEQATEKLRLSLFETEV